MAQLQIARVMMVDWGFTGDFAVDFTYVVPHHLLLAARVKSCVTRCITYFLSSRDVSRVV